MIHNYLLRRNQVERKRDSIDVPKPFLFLFVCISCVCFVFVSILCVYNIYSGPPAESWEEATTLMVASASWLFNSLRCTLSTQA